MMVVVGGERSELWLFILPTLFLFHFTSTGVSLKKTASTYRDVGSVILHGVGKYIDRRLGYLEGYR